MTRFLRVIPAAVVVLVAALGPLILTVAGLPGAGVPVGGPFVSPGPDAPLGTDRLGRSVLSGVLAGGTRLVLAAIVVGVLVTALATILGGFAALHPRLRALVDACADAALLVPAVLVLLLVPVLAPGAGLAALVGVCVLLGVPYAVKVVAASMGRVAERGFVAAARDGGESTLSIVAIDLIPHSASVLRSVLGLRIIEALYLLSVASFLGVDGGLGDHSWSTMVRTGAEGVLLSPWAVVSPAAMLALTGIAVLALTHGGEAAAAEAVADAG